jgi:hypothetical protein
MSAYSSEAWSDFLVAAAGASAALAGLVFIGVSINLTRILAFPGLPARAGQTIVVLANALAVSLAVLGPMDSRVGTGVEVLLLGLVGWVAVIVIQARSGEDDTTRAHRRSAMVMLQIATIPFLVSGASMLVEWGGGLYWMQAGLILSMIVGLGNGWVLLVEILR